ncbi:ATP-binding protein [Pseudonocardia alaniniphila]|uniref:ATP-binding protein n=1 Tax=Pseudonocardia alaniniphila TaxID=75291 RepID=A0ABS9T839_9PSEU|nr:ATP-binding protein [Pseudonocardia alaniniphila]MCH6164651.1 ATP-binding protein [Pseudonocardia alaniniphila]
MTVYAGDDGARSGRTVRWAGAAAPVVDTLTMHMLAEPTTPSVVRARFRKWLEGHGWPADAVDDVILSVHEAVANVIDHAYPAGYTGDVAVTATLLAEAGRRRVRIVVRDRGRWRSPPTDPGYRGRGLQMVRSCMEDVEILPGVHSRDGTEITMLSAPVTPAAGVGRSSPAPRSTTCRPRSIVATPGGKARSWAITWRCPPVPPAP